MNDLLSNAVLPKHFRRAIEPDADGCWLWQLHLSVDGYGRGTWHNRTWEAHRAVYTMLRGEIPAGLVLDHLCRVRHCVNPDHLEPVTLQENLRRSPFTQSGLTACRKCGGPFTMAGRRRRCVPCKTQYEHDRYLARKKAGAK